MKSQTELTAELAALRKRVESLLVKQTEDEETISSELGNMKLIHELEVYQIELQMLNEELIRARHRAEEEADKYIELYDFSPSGYFTLSTEGVILDLNLNGVAMLGKERSKLRNSRFGFFVSMDTRPEFNHFLTKVFESKNKETCQVTIEAEGRPSTYVRLSGILATNGEHCLLTAMNITESKLAQDALKESEEKYRHVFENIQDLYFKTDIAGTILEICPSCESFFGMSDEEMIGTSSFSLYNHPDDRAIMIEELSKKKELRDYELELKTINGKIRIVSLNARMLSDDKGKPKYLDGIIRDVTDRKNDSNTILNSEIRYRRLFESAKDGILNLDAETGMIIDVNPFLVNLLGYSAEQFIEKAIWEIGFFKDIVANKDKFLELKAHEYVRYENLPLETASGKKIEVEFVSNVYLVENRKVIQCNIRDISTRHRAEKKVQLLSKAVAQSPVTVVITDKLGNIEYANPKFTETTGYTLEEAIGQNPRILKSGDKPDEYYKTLWETILSGKEWSGEFRNKRKNGELYWESAVISPIYDTNGVITNFVAVKEDITSRKLTEQELIIAKEHAEESDRLKSAFLANMSHEIRTPMNGILGFSGLLKEPGLSGDEQQEYIRIIEKSGARMLNIINDIIDISKIEAGLMQVVLAETDVNIQLNYINTFFTPEAEAKGLGLTVVTPLPSSNAIISTDREKLYAILTNLVKNAIKFTDSGSIEMGYSLKHTAGLESSPALEFYVKDTGIGVTADRQKAIFDRFVQADIADSRAYQGAGLGLSISRAYTEMLGGRLWVESVEGKGAAFYFTLPYNIKKVETQVEADAAVVVARASNVPENSDC